MHRRSRPPIVLERLLPGSCGSEARGSSVAVVNAPSLSTTRSQVSTDHHLSCSSVDGPAWQNPPGKRKWSVPHKGACRHVSGYLRSPAGLLAVMEAANPRPHHSSGIDVPISRPSRVIILKSSNTDTAATKPPNPALVFRLSSPSIRSKSRLPH